MKGQWAVWAMASMCRVTGFMKECRTAKRNAAGLDSGFILNKF